MAAIIEPHRLHPAPAPRPALRLVPAHGGRPVDVRADLGLGPVHLAIAVVALLLAMVLAVAIGNGALASLAPAAPGATPAATAEVQVQAGDTYWSVARRLQPTGDVRPLVDQLVALNGSAPLQAGQEILVPR